MSLISPGEIVGIVGGILLALVAFATILIHRSRSSLTSTTEMEQPQPEPNEMPAVILSTLHQSSKVNAKRTPPPISIPENSLSLVVSSPLRSAGSNASTLRITHIEGGDRGADEEEILSEDRRHPGDASIDSHSRICSSAGFSTAVRSEARTSFSPFRTFFEHLTPSMGVQEGSNSGSVSLPPPPRRRASRASTSSVSNSSALEDVEFENRADSLDRQARQERPVSEQLASYVLDTFSSSAACSCSNGSSVEDEQQRVHEPASRSQGQAQAQMSVQVSSLLLDAPYSKAKKRSRSQPRSGSKLQTETRLVHRRRHVDQNRAIKYLHPTSAPASRKGSSSPSHLEEQDQGRRNEHKLPSPIYARASAWSADTSSAYSSSPSRSVSDKNSDSDSRSASKRREHSRDQSSVGKVKPRSKDLHGNRSSLRSSSSPIWSNSTSSLSLRAQVERAQAWLELDEEQRCLRSPRMP